LNSIKILFKASQLITDLTKKIEEIPELGPHVSICEQGFGSAFVNGGSIVWKATKQSHELVNEIIHSKPEWESLTFNVQDWFIKHRVRLSDRLTICPKRTFNSVHHGNVMLWEPGDFVYHPCGFPINDRCKVLQEMNKKLFGNKIMNNKKIYIEAGAHNGIFQSRTLDFIDNNEYFGILVEPVPSSYEKCLQNRPNNTKIYKCALVGFDHIGSTAEIYPHFLHSSMTTLVKSSNKWYHEKRKVPARTLDSILEENDINDIEEFYLNVEGYELNVLKGIDFSKRKFKLIEIECHAGLIDISLEEEINNHKKFLSSYGYVLFSQNYEDTGNAKIVFKQK
jgi:FkbM family methyltransferase